MSDHVLSPTQVSPWDVKSIRHLATRNGGAFTGVLLHHGVPVADLEQGGHGAETDIDWRGLTSMGMPMSAQYNSPTLQKLVPTIQAARTAWIELRDSLPPVQMSGLTLVVSDGWMAEDLISIVELKKRCLKKLCFTTKGKEYALNGPDNAEARAWLVRKHPDAVILNDLWGPSVAPAAPAAPVAPVAPARVPPTLAQLMRGEVGS